MSNANKVRFIENETGKEVIVETFYTWSGNPVVCAVEYPSTAAHAKRYGVTEEYLRRHFTIVSPQNIEINALAIDYRPTLMQAALDQAIDRRMAEIEAHARGEALPEAEPAAPQPTEAAVTMTVTKEE